MIPDISVIFLPFMKDTIISCKNSFFPFTISEWSKLGKLETQPILSLPILKKNLLKKNRPCANSSLGIHDSYGIKLLKRLRLGLSHPRHHKFRHYFQNTLNPLSDCHNDTETTAHLFLHFPRFNLLE